MTEQFINHSFNGITGEVTLIPYTDQEIADVLAQRKLLAENEAKVLEAATDKAALLAKLGITADEAKLLLS